MTNLRSPLVAAALFVCVLAGGTSIKDATAKIETDISDKIEIRLTPPSGTKLNFDGPWKLTLSDSVPTKQRTLKKSDFDKEQSRFLVDLNGSSEFSGDYKLVYFICSEDNKWCKRNVAKGSLKRQVQQ